MVNEGKREFLKYAGYTIFASVPVAYMFYTMWVGGTWRYAFALANSVVFVPDGATGVIAGLLFGLGIYLGLLLLFMQNRKKYYQGVLLLLGTTAALASLGLLGIGLPGFEPSLLNIGSFLAGLMLTAIAETVESDRSIPLTNGVKFEGRLHQIDRRKSSWGHAVDARGNELEFPIATYGLIGFIVSIVFIANVMNFIVADGIGGLQLLHVGTSLIFLKVMTSFLSLNPSSDTDLQVLGPTQSGKTYFVLATALEAKRNGRFEMEEAKGWINELIEDHKEWAKKKREYSDQEIDIDANQETDDGEIDWNIGFTPPEQTYRTDFTIVIKDRIPKSLHFDVIDHAGELLGDLADRVDNPAVADGGVENNKFVCSGCETGFVDESLQAGEECPQCENGEIYKPENLPDGSEDSDNTRLNNRGVDVNSLIEDIDKIPDSNKSGSNQEESSESSEIESESIESGEKTEDEVTTTDGDSTTDADTKNKQIGETTVEQEDTDTTTSKNEIVMEPGSAEGDTTRSSSPKQGTQSSPSDEGDMTGDEFMEKFEVLEELEEKVSESDILVMMLDCVRLIGGEPAGPGSGSLETAQMNRIINGADPDRVVLVATKADVLIDDWKGWHRTNRDGSLSQDRIPEPHELDQYQQSFQDYVTNEIDNATGTLLNNADAGTVYPVYFETQRSTGETESSDKRSDDIWVPEPNANGELQPHGYGEVLAAIARDGN